MGWRWVTCHVNGPEIYFCEKPQCGIMRCNKNRRALGNMHVNGPEINLHLTRVGAEGSTCFLAIHEIIRKAFMIIEKYLAVIGAQ
jgi:hypothetical protein